MYTIVYRTLCEWLCGYISSCTRVSACLVVYHRVELSTLSETNDHLKQVVLCSALSLALSARLYLKYIISAKRSPWLREAHNLSVYVLSSLSPRDPRSYQTCHIFDNHDRYLQTLSDFKIIFRLIVTCLIDLTLPEKKCHESKWLRLITRAARDGEIKRFKS